MMNLQSSGLLLSEYCSYGQAADKLRKSCRQAVDQPMLPIIYLLSPYHHCYLLSPIPYPMPYGTSAKVSSVFSCLSFTSVFSYNTLWHHTNYKYIQYSVYSINTNKKCWKSPTSNFKLPTSNFQPLIPTAISYLQFLIQCLMIPRRKYPLFFSCFSLTSISIMIPL